MPRIPYPEGAAELPAYQPGNIRTLNVERMLCYLPDNIRAELGTLGKTLLWRGALDPVYRELALVRVGHLCHSAYELHHHKAFARTVGISETQLEGLRTGDLSSAFTPSQRAVLAFTDDIVNNVRASDQTLEPLQKHLSNSEIMELMVVVGYYASLCRILETFGPEIDDFALAPTPR